MGLPIASIPVQVTFKTSSIIGDLLKARAKDRHSLLASPSLHYGLPRIRTVSDAARHASGFSIFLNVSLPVENSFYQRDRYKPDGSIYYIGRRDNQIKMHGQEFEVEGLEKAISACPFVRHVLATVHISADNHKYLVAVLSLTDPQLPSKTALQGLPEIHEPVVSKHLTSIQEVLSSRLPSYMIPTAWLVVEQLPRTASSKIDQRSIKQWLM